MRRLSSIYYFRLKSVILLFLIFQMTVFFSTGFETDPTRAEFESDTLNAKLILNPINPNFMVFFNSKHR